MAEASTEAVSTINKLVEELRAQTGVEYGRRVSLPVDRSSIRLWAIGTRWPEPPKRIYWDEEYAKQTRWGGIIAPPGFNPFAYHVDEERMQGPSTYGLLRTGTGNRGINAGGEATYYAPIRPGDVITSVSKIVEVGEPRVSRLGPSVFVKTETRWTNQRGELVRVYLGIGMRY